jgi:hypothetical protein
VSRWLDINPFASFVKCALRASVNTRFKSGVDLHLPSARHFKRNQVMTLICFNLSVHRKHYIDSSNDVLQFLRPLFCRGEPPGPLMRSPAAIRYLTETRLEALAKK